MLSFCISTKRERKLDQHRSKNFDLTLTHDQGRVEKSDIEFLQISIHFIELGTKIVDMLLIMICMIPKVNLVVEKWDFFIIYLCVSLKLPFFVGYD